MPIDYLANRLRTYHKDWQHVDDLKTIKSSLGGSFYLSPKRHVVENIFFSSFFTFGFMTLYEAALRTGGPIDLQMRQHLPTFERHWTDNYWLAALFFSLGLTVLYKYIRGGGLFLLQPCHVSATMLICVLWGDPTQAWPHIVFNLALSIMWGSWMAVLFPDLRDYKLFFEVENFWLEHALIVGLPLVWIAQRRFLVFPGDFVFNTAAFTLNAAFHSVVLHTVALLSGANLNYQLQPPPVKVVENLGKNYKWVMYLFTYLLTLVTRYVFVELVVTVTGAYWPVK